MYKREQQGTEENFLLLLDMINLKMISVTTKVVVIGCSFTTATTPRVLLQAHPHLLPPHLLQFLLLQAKMLLTH